MVEGYLSSAYGYVLPQYVAKHGLGKSSVPNHFKEKGKNSKFVTHLDKGETGFSVIS